MDAGLAGMCSEQCVFARTQLTWARIRKVKCDEGRPSCHRCLSTGRTCDGEIGTAITASRKLLDRTRPLLPMLANSAQTRREGDLVSANTVSTIASVQSNLSVWPDFAYGLSNYEQHGFQHFQQVTAPALQVMLPSPGWIQTALQLCVYQPAVFHAIIATGTMARALTVLTHASFTRPILGDLAYEAIKQYDRAIKVLRNHVENAMPASVDVEPMLLACLLCVCFEAFQGRCSAAVEHTHLGWKIMKDYAKNTSTMRSSSAEFFRVVFQNNNGGFALFSHKEAHDQYCCMEHLTLTMPQMFNSLEEATETLKALAMASDHFRSELLRSAEAHPACALGSHHKFPEAMRFCLSACLSRTVKVSDQQHARLMQLKLAHTHWEHTNMMYEQTSLSDDIERRLLLRIRYFFSKFTLACCRDTEETLSDRFLDDFKTALDLVERYLIVVANGNAAVPFFGSSILPTIDLIAQKCRVPQLRRRALRLLLNMRKREGLEYSQSLGQYAQAVAEIEEHRSSIQVQDQEDGLNVIPEQARFSDVVTVGEGASGIFHLICARYTDNTTKRIELAVYEGGAVPLRLCSTREVDV